MIKKWVGVNIDITDQKQQGKELLAAREDRFRKTFENLLNGFSMQKPIFDTAGKVIAYAILALNSVKSPPVTKLTLLFSITTPPPRLRLTTSAAI